MRDADWTYFIKDFTSGLVKIGRCTGPVQSRLRTLQCHNPGPLSILGAVRGNQELKLHSRFSHLRRYREWFECTPELLDFIDKHCNPVEIVPDKTECCTSCRRKAVIGTGLCTTCVRPWKSL